jgi:hypothetical protein
MSPNVLQKYAMSMVKKSLDDKFGAKEIQKHI